MALPRSFPGYGWGWDPYQYAPGLNQMQLFSSGVGSGLTTPGFGSPSSASAFNPMSGLLSNQSASLSPLLQSLILQQQAATQPQPQAQGQPIVQHNPVTGFTVPLDALATVKNYITNVLGLNPQSFPQGTLEQAAQNIEQAVSTNTGPLATTTQSPFANLLTSNTLGNVTGLVGAVNAAAGGPPEVGQAVSAAKIGQELLSTASAAGSAAAGGLLGAGAQAGTDIMGSAAGSGASISGGALLGPAIGAITGGLNAGLSGHTNRIVGEMLAGAIPFVGPFYQLGELADAMQNAAIEGKYQREAKAAMSSFNTNPDVLNVGSNLSSLMAGNTGALGPLDAAIIQAQRAKTAVDQPEGSSGVPIANWVASLFQNVRGTPAEAQLYSSLAGQAGPYNFIDRRTPAEKTPYATVTNMLGYAPGPPPSGTVLPPAPPQQFSFGSPNPTALPVNDPYAAYRPPPPPPPPPVMGGQNLSGTGVNMLAMAPSIQYHP